MYPCVSCRTACGSIGKEIFHLLIVVPTDCWWLYLFAHCKEEKAGQRLLLMLMAGGAREGSFHAGGRIDGAQFSKPLRLSSVRLFRLSLENPPRLTTDGRPLGEVPDLNND